ncbi:hypothetical protein [Bacillus vallismortis]|uniref:Uncharacterized protein n=2 Tax=Bacillus vallismortis TaxID=72361 RepID=A0AAP3CK16_BACVA|nr:hypothetical protein [Bacillus vallismortis]MBG9767426.1 hypothetical protein [Bacillus vallismortis]MCI3983995.1 hypothetical protein [Bacillus vallismortis]MCI4136414.1 hypothetical protein [Bacillus vallismortis]MCY7893692.1 hypothetical protein [Bacillus vallismortis]MCY7917679.1 hypothetical protein [Bacillus vallismortis]
MDKYPFPYNIRHKLSFFRDTFDMTIQNAHTLTVSWALSEETMQLAEAVLFESPQDMIKELRIVLKRKDIEAVRTIRTAYHKGEWTLGQAAGDAVYRAEYRIVNSMNVSLKLADTGDIYLAENGVSNLNSFQTQNADIRWEKQFSAYTCYGKGEEEQ